MTSFPKTAHWNPLVHNDEIVDKTTNPHSKNQRILLVAENESEFVLVKQNFQYASVFLGSHQLTKNQEFCEKNIQTYHIRETRYGGVSTH